MGGALPFVGLVGEGEYKRYGEQLAEEKITEEKIEGKIRQLRKDRNKARLHPMREQGPSRKRRKVNDGEYINIKEIWDKPRMSTTTKRTKETENKIGTKKSRERSPEVRENKNEYTGIRLTRTVDVIYENEEV